MRQERSLSISLPGIVSAGWLVMLLGCTNNDDITAWSYVCGNEVPLPTEDVPAGTGALRRGGYSGRPAAAGALRAAGEQWPPPDPPAECILKASRVTPPEGQVLDEPLLKTKEEERTVLDSVRIQAALDTCKVVKLVTDGDKNAFLSSRLVVAGGKCDGTGPCLTCNVVA